MSTTTNRLLTLDETLDILEGCRQKRVLLLVHINCDIDAYASAMGLSCLFTDPRIVTPYSVSQPVKRLSSAGLMQVEEAISMDGYEQLIVLDSSSQVQIKDFELPSENVLIIDHHASMGDWEGRPVYSDNKTSCAEVVYDILLKMDVEIPENIKSLLVAGVVADTGKFRYASSDSFLSISRMLEGSQVTMDSIFTLLEDESPRDVSRTIAVFKGLKRVQYTNVDGHMIAISHVGSFEAAVCRAITLCGADVAFVLNTKERDSVRISGRAKPFVVKQGLSLARLFQDIGEELGLQGGGHDGAAGLNGRGDGQNALKVCERRAIQFFQNYRDASEKHNF